MDIKKVKFCILSILIAITIQTNGQKDKSRSIEIKTETEIEYTWDNSSQEWMKSAFLNYDYNSIGNLSTIVKTDAQTNANLLKINYYYTASFDLLAYEIYEWTEMGWIGDTKYSYDYIDDKTIKQLIQAWNNITWQNSSLDSIYIYDENDLLVQSTNFRWGKNEWLQDHIIYYEYGENLKVCRKYSVSMSGINLSQVFYSYNPDGNYSEMYAQFFKNGQWENGWKRIYEYDNCGNLYSVIRQAWILDNWVNNTKSLYIMGLFDNGSESKKVPVCHKGHTITVSVNAAEAHLKHGDCLGECADEINPDINEGYQVKKNIYNESFEIFPNPSKYQFIIRAKDPFNLIKRVELIDINGNIVRSVPANNTPEVEIDRNGLKNGKYFVKITGNKIVTSVVILN